ncbi:MAG: hypothetical protein ABI364_06170, partial [Caldimonas sp.]
MPGSFASRWRALAAVAACALLLAPLAGQAADEPDNGGLFSTPGYPPRTTPGVGGTANGSAATGGLAQPQLNGRSGGNGVDNANRDNAGARNGREQGDVFPRRAAPPPPPPKPNEFQRFVEGATGRLLPIFGASFFADAADSFQSLDNVPVSADYTIGPGDEIVTRAWGSIDV